MSEIRVAKLYEDAILPTRKNPIDAGMDLYAFIPTWREGLSWTADPHNFLVVGTGITVEIPKGYVGFIFPKSKNWHLVGAGIVDDGYQGEIFVKIVNILDIDLEINHGDAIAQLVIVPVYTPEIVETPLDEIHKVKTFRGKTGGIVEQVATVTSKPDFFIERWD